MVQIWLHWWQSCPTWANYHLPHETKPCYLICPKSLQLFGVSAQCIAMGELMAFLTQQTCQQCEQARDRDLINISDSRGHILANMIFLAGKKVYLSHEFYWPWHVEGKTWIIKLLRIWKLWGRNTMINDKLTSLQSALRSLVLRVESISAEGTTKPLCLTATLVRKLKTVSYASLSMGMNFQLQCTVWKEYFLKDEWQKRTKETNLNNFAL